MGPPVAPVVTYRDGLLSVQALNSNLSSVVTAIRNKTGIEFEGAEGISERVAIALGPAPEGDVLAAIFAGSKYDFLAIGRADSPSDCAKGHSDGEEQARRARAEAQAQQQPPAANQGEEEEVPEEQPNAGEPQDTPVQPPVPQPPPQAENAAEPAAEDAGAIAARATGDAPAKRFAGGSNEQSQSGSAENAADDRTVARLEVKSLLLPCKELICEKAVTGNGISGWHLIVAWDNSFRRCDWLCPGTIFLFDGADCRRHLLHSVRRDGSVRANLDD